MRAISINWVNKALILAAVAMVSFSAGGVIGGRSRTKPVVVPFSIHEASFTDPLYEADITYLRGGSVADLRQYVAMKHPGAQPMSWGDETNLEDGTDAYEFHVATGVGDDEHFYVWMHDEHPEQRLLFHETLHLTSDILWFRGIKYTSESEEAFCYLGGWIFEQAQKAGVR
jgi:hypothetical protein